MDATREALPRFDHFRETANDRFKRRAPIWQSNALVLAVLTHFAVLGLWPTMTAGVMSQEERELEVLTIPDIEIPEPPAEIARPAPIVSTTLLDESVTIPDNVRFTDFTSERLKPPPTAPGVNRDEFKAFMPDMVAPRVLNQAEVERALARNYPPLLRDAGVGGKVDVLMWLDEKGTIVRFEIGKSSGYRQLDEAAAKVIDVMKLSPALNRSQPTRVIVTIPIMFDVR